MAIFMAASNHSTCMWRRELFTQGTIILKKVSCEHSLKLVSVCDKAIWGWVLSAYCCSWNPKCLVMLVTEEVNIVNNKEPKTDPYGTPAVQNVGSYRAVAMRTC